MLAASNFVDCTVLRYALGQAQAQILSEQRSNRFSGLGNAQAALNAKLELLRTSLQLSSTPGYCQSRWFIVFVFVWTSWQRFLLLHLYQGGDAGGIQGLRLVPQVFDIMERHQKKLGLKTPYLCGWAYKTLQNDQNNIAMDLRRFYELYNNHFKEKYAICGSDSTQCDGSSSYACGRFKDTQVVNQSAHAPQCDGTCRRLFWDPFSFLAVSGPKAVDIESTNESSIRYCRATNLTLTISHVWSHGQGGRPDNSGSEGTGFNTCLHRRYSDIAISFGYSSYWMDTPCIPSEPKLRWDCIQNITGIFARSEKTLVCDRDLMSVDISTAASEAYETILAILLVCDWSMRAWTLLESIRGHDLFILCKDDDIISLGQIVAKVRQHGRIELPILFSRRKYLLPHPDIYDLNMDFFDTGELIVDEECWDEVKGFINIGEAAELLSHRHPTRDGDDLLIWSLLIGDLEDKDTVALWRRQIRKKIPVGSLISSAPRLKTVGLGWAPSSPVLRSKIDAYGGKRKAYAPFDGEMTMTGLITPDGLLSSWMVFKFLSAKHARPTQNIDSTERIEFYERLSVIVRQLTAEFTWGVLLMMCPRRGSRDVPIEYPKCKGQMLVVCASQDGSRWQWRNIYEWEKNVSLPQFTLEKILIV